MSANSHLSLVAAAKTAINRVFKDKTVDQDDTRESLKELRDEIDLLLDSLDE